MTAGGEERGQGGTDETGRPVHRHGQWSGTQRGHGSMRGQVGRELRCRKRNVCASTDPGTGVSTTSVTLWSPWSRVRSCACDASAAAGTPARPRTGAVACTRRAVPPSALRRAGAGRPFRPAGTEPPRAPGSAARAPPGERASSCPVARARRTPRPPGASMDAGMTETPCSPHPARRCATGCSSWVRDAVGRRRRSPRTPVRRGPVIDSTVCRAPADRADRLAGVEPHGKGSAQPCGGSRLMTTLLVDQPERASPGSR